MMADMQDEELTTTLQNAIRKSGLSLYALAKLSGVSKGQLSRFMAGERDIRLTNAGKLCKALGLQLKPTRSKNK